LESKEATDSGLDSKALQDYVSSPPKYDTSNRFKRKLTDEVIDLIQRQLDDNQRKRQEGLRKQIKRKIDIHENLLSQGILIGYTTVCNHIQEKELRSQEAFIKQIYIPGEECEFDWAEIKLTIDGVKRRLFLAVFTSSYSNYRFALLFNRQDTLAFMEAHNAFFAHTQGVFQEMVYDNMRVAIREFVGRTDKHPTDALVQLAGWFQFRWRFCNVRRGNEKGHVERSVEYIRRKAFCNIDTFDSLQLAQKHLTQTCDRLNSLPGVQEKIPQKEFQQEKASLWKYPGGMECFITHCLKVDKYSTVCFGTNHYSVPDTLCGRMVEVKVYSNELNLYFAHGLVARHERSYGRGQWIFNLEHYLKTLERKPGALHGSLALDQAPEAVKEVYTRWFVNQARDFIQLLQFCKQADIDHQKLLETAIYVNGLCAGEVTSEKITAILGNQPPAQSSRAAEEVLDEIANFSSLQLEEIARMINANMEAVV